MKLKSSSGSTAKLNAPDRTRRLSRWGRIGKNHFFAPAGSSAIRFEKMKIFAVMFVGALAVAGCQKQAAVVMPPPEVATVTVTTQKVLLTTELPGRTAPYLIAEIRPQVSGLLLKRLFTEGSDVTAGQELYQIDPAPFQAALDSAEANLPSLRSRAARFKEALSDKSVSQQDFDDADGALKQAEAQAATARINLGYTRITSPISGRIGKSAVTDGAIVTAYQATPLAVIQQLDPIYVDVPQSTAEVLKLERRLKNGTMNGDSASASQVELFLEDGTQYSLKGTLQFRDVSVDPTTASVILRMVFPNPNGVLLPGMFVRAKIEEGINEQAILIPQQAVSRDPKGNPLAMLVGADGKAARRDVVLDRALGDQWLVTSGLAPGDQLIVEGGQNAKPGMAVRVVPFNAGPTNATPKK